MGGCRVAGVECDEFFSVDECFVGPLVGFFFAWVGFLVFVFDELVVRGVDVENEVGDFVEEDAPKLTDVFVFEGVDDHCFSGVEEAGAATVGASF